MASPSMLDLYDYSGVAEVCYADAHEESYRKAAAFLGPSCEDWGCGTGWASHYFADYRGVDGSLGWARERTELADYRSDVEAVLIRQVLEHNVEWRTILDNAKASFRRRLCVIIHTPCVARTYIAWCNPVYRADGTVVPGRVIPEVFFAKADVLACFPTDAYRVTEETIDVEIGYGSEWILYVERLGA